MTLPTTGYVRQAQLLAGGVPFSAATLWRKVRAQTFPAPVKLSAGVTAWRVEDVRAWMENQPARPGNARSTGEEGGPVPVIDDALIERLAAALAAQLPPPIPIEIDLWDVATIARLLKRNESQVRNRVVCLPDFPKAIRLPIAAGPRLYRAAEVLTWVSKYQDRD
jgi:predicted DNA-binding transcriptional regulator AlpA